MTGYSRILPCNRSGGIVRKTRAGPNPYVGGGFTVLCPEFRTVSSAIITSNIENLLGVNDREYAIKWTISGTTITIKCYALDTSGGGKVWTELAAGNLSGVTFVIDVLGY